MTLRTVKHLQAGRLVPMFLVAAGLLALVFTGAGGEPPIPVARTAAAEWSYTIPTAAHSAGTLGTSWRTDLEVHNPGSTQASYTIALLKRDTDNHSLPADAVRSFTLDPGLSARYADVIDSLFHFSGAAALRITPTSGEVLVTSRTYTALGAGNPLNLPAGSTFGQLVPGLTPDQAIATGQQGRLIQLAHRDPSSKLDYRTNLGYVNAGDATIAMVTDLFGADGALLGSVTDSLRPHEYKQIDKVFGRVTPAVVADGYAIVRTTTPGAAFFAYASVIDNRTGDPVFIPAQRTTASAAPTLTPTPTVTPTLAPPTPTPTATPPEPTPTPTTGELTVTLPGGVPLVMVRIPAGAFQMGSPTSERNREAGETLHQVTLTSDYYLGKFEVTQGQWRAVMGTGPSSHSSCGDDCPVEQVSWTDVRGATGFLEMLNAHLTSTGQTGAGRFRLPTEAEWERAARGGTQTRFSFGDALAGDDFGGANPEADPFMWFGANSAGSTHPVGQKQANQYGLHDMHGNVWEWGEDWFGSYPSTAQTNPTGPATGSSRVWRGGSYSYELRGCRAAMRFGYDPGRRYDVGFRVAMSPAPDPSTPTDADGYVYRTVTIGNQVWLAENLRARHDVGGAALPDASAYGNNAGNVATYGRLYSFTTARMPMIAGWHLPTYDEWTTLINAVGAAHAGELLRLGGGSGFDAVLGGYRDYGGGFRELGIWGEYWTATVMNVVPADHAHIVHLQQGQPQAARMGAGFTAGNSVRLVKDN
ncbi:MAG: SUMF1/EgtB/PvdO family nonheme iron enzyme [Thermoanaerobaculaceae bacterium]|jgi:uncharacterized protein (TIGR02145 family)|nr:SUMF1/EgtB/PvdO family nonheme iron enzyme [Thermoanaerobaculaceae bacterium]